jgi:hypothetical protein
LAIRLPDGSIQLADGRIVYANSLILGADLCEIVPLCVPPPAWPFVSGGGGGGPGPQGPAGPAGSGGGGAGTQGQQGFQGTNPGPQGNQGNAGTAGAVGAQGNQGNQGNAGTAGAAGAQGNQGTAGTQGFQGNVGTGAQGNQGNQGIAGTQGFQGFQGALNPDIFVATRVVSLVPGEGTDLTIAAAIAALPAGGGSIYMKEGTFPQAATLTLTDKPILFVGSGDATIIALGANAISAFTIGFDQPYKFQNLKILGTGIVGQTAFEFNIGASSAEIVTVENVTVENIEKTFLVAGTDFPLVYTSDCSFEVANLATSFHWDGTGEWHAVNTSALFTGGTQRGGFANNPDLYWTNSLINLANGGAVNYVQIDRCLFQGTLTVAAQGSIIGDSNFDTPGATRYIDLPVGANSVGISNCMFGSASAEQIRIASQNCNIVGCQPCEVTETGAADLNRYVNNIGFTASTIIGPGSIVEEAGRFDATGTATVDALTALFTHTNFKGLAGAGSIKNTGGTNSLRVRRTGTDAYGVTDFQEDVVLPGAALVWPMDTALGTALPEFVSFTVSVRSEVAGNPTTFSLHHTSHGVMS